MDKLRTTALFGWLAMEATYIARAEAERTMYAIAVHVIKNVQFSSVHQTRGTQRSEQTLGKVD
jgi:hypothetical protein